MVDRFGGDPDLHALPAAEGHEGRGEVVAHGLDVGGVLEVDTDNRHGVNAVEAGAGEKVRAVDELGGEFRLVGEAAPRVGGSLLQLSHPGHWVTSWDVYGGVASSCAVPVGRVVS